MKLKKIVFIMSLILSILSVLVFLIEGLNYVRLDKIPIIRYFVLEIELWPSAFDASYLDGPITWEQLDEEPRDWDQKGTGPWFSFNQYTKKLLKRHMRKNNLGIVPGRWSDFRFTVDFEDCLETFDFVKLPNSSKEENVPKNNAIIIGIMGIFLSILSWVFFGVVSRKQNDISGQ